MPDTRHPYTNSCDFLREAAGFNFLGGVKLSRGEASLIRKAVAEALDMKDEELAVKLSIAFKRKHGLEEDNGQKEEGTEVFPGDGAEGGNGRS